MTTTHRTLEGTWAVCPNPAGCELLFHFPDRTPEAMADIPLELLSPLLNTIQPPDSDSPNPGAFVEGYLRGSQRAARLWLRDGAVMHRDYDLPAVILADGEQQWWLDGVERRANGGPTTVRADGTQEWWAENGLHREGGLPAKIYPDGTREWWRNGWRQKEPVFHWRRPADT